MLTSRELELNESQRQLLQLALTIAAAQFKEDATAVRESPSGFGLQFSTDSMRGSARERLARQYEEQARDAAELSGRIEQSRWIRLGPAEEAGERRRRVSL